MKNNILLALALVLVLTGAGCTSNSRVDVNGDYNDSSTTPSVYNSSVLDAEGRVVIAITDAATAMTGVSAIYLTLDKVEMHSAAKGWVTVSNETSQYELLSLKNKNTLMLAAQTTLPGGTYNQIRLHVKKIEVVKSGRKVEAKLPSDKIEVTGQFIVSGSATTTITVDFVADESLHVTGNGMFIFAPVIKTQSRLNASVSVDPNGKVMVSSGRVDSDATMGMTLEGVMRDNFKLDADSKLEIKNNVIREIAASGTAKVEND